MPVLFIIRPHEEGRMCVVVAAVVGFVVGEEGLGDRAMGWGEGVMRPIGRTTG